MNFLHSLFYLTILVLLAAGPVGCEKKSATSSTEQSSSSHNAKSSNTTTKSSDASSSEQANNDSGTSSEESTSDKTSSDGTSLNEVPSDFEKAVAAHDRIAEKASNAHKSEDTAVSGDNNALVLTGLRLTVPESWVVQPITQAGAMAPQAVYNLPKAEGDAEDGQVRITYFPRMKGMDDANIDRWIRQMRNIDGSTIGRDEATITSSSVGSVHLTTVDVSGLLSAGMMGEGEVKSNQRMIAVIVNHPKGPHFIRATGPQNTIAKWKESIDAFLGSAAVTD